MLSLRGKLASFEVTFKGVKLVVGIIMVLDLESSRGETRRPKLVLSWELALSTG